MHIVLFARDLRGSTETLGFASRVFASLGLSQTEERESSNYPPEERYFIGYAANASVMVSRSEDDELPQYPFYVVIQDADSRVQAVETIPLNIAEFAETLTADEMQLFHPSAGWSKMGWTPSGTVYGGA